MSLYATARALVDRLAVLSRSHPVVASPALRPFVDAAQLELSIESDRRDLAAELAALRARLLTSSRQGDDP